MRPWQRWFWRRDAQLLLWLVIALFLGWLLLGPPMGTSQDFAQAVAQAADRDVILLVNRRGQVAYVVLEHRSPG